MRVLHLVKTSIGAAWVHQQVSVLCRSGIEVVVALPCDSTGLAPLYRAAGARVIGVNLDFPARDLWRLPARLRKCRELVREVEPDLIHTHHVGPTLMARMSLGRKSPIPRIFQVAGPLHLEHTGSARLEFHTRGPRDYWIATCEWTRNRYVAMAVPDDRVFLSYSGCDIERFQPARTGRLRAELGLPWTTPLIGMVCYMYAPKTYLGQTRGLKGHEDFFQAFRRIVAARPETRAVVIGGAWGDAARYENQLRGLGRRLCGDALTFLGTRTDVPTLYPDLNVAVVASHSENVGGAVEPLLCGVPVVATNVGGLPDLVRDGQTGWLVPARNPEAMAGAILDALQNRTEARRRTTAGQALAAQMFDVRATAHQVLQVYEKALASHCLGRQMLPKHDQTELEITAKCSPIATGNANSY